jgi:arylsulfatase A-like enzyme
MSPRSQGTRKPNIVLFGIDSLKGSHLSCYGYPRQTSPHIDRFAQGGAIFEKAYSPHIPTTSGYGSMLTGRDVFGTQIVALRHKGSFAPGVPTLAEILKKQGYTTSCVGFTGNPAARGFDTYVNYSGWGAWNSGRSPKAQSLNEVAAPEIDRLARGKKPFFVLLRHMDPHMPYLPPAPYERMFYHGNQSDPKNQSMKPVMTFKPFCDFFATALPPGISDKDYVIAQYDGAVAYMDACIQTLFTQLETLGLLDNTIVVVNSDHGETLYDHECWFDHHGIYDNTLHIPLIIRYPKRIPAGLRVKGYTQQKDLVPTLLDLAGIKTRIRFDGQSLMQLVTGEKASLDSEFYITECTWMRKHGWRTPEWKLIVALEPDFHFKPPVELYNLVEDPKENNNLAKERPDVVALLRKRMLAHIARREKETGLPNPILNQPGWHGIPGIAYFKSSRQAYDSLHIGDPKAAAKLQEETRK